MNTCRMWTAFHAELRSLEGVMTVEARARRRRLMRATAYLMARIKRA